MRKPTLLSLILKELEKERRIIAADWRIHVIYMRIAHSGGFALPTGSKVKQLIRKLAASGDIEELSTIAGIYVFTVPFASFVSSPDEALLQEANPTAVLSHYTAAAYHNLTYELPMEYHLTYYPNSFIRLPLGTVPEDWVDVPKPRCRTPKTIRGKPILWHKSKKEWDFGHTLGFSQGYPIYVTDLERTLLDAIRFPERCGGITEVFRIWRRAVDSLRVDVLVNYVEQFSQALLRQRVGFILEEIGITPPILEEWANKSVRGSSAKLIANSDFAPTFSERWKLSINVPESILSELKEE